MRFRAKLEKVESDLQSSSSIATDSLGLKIAIKFSLITFGITFLLTYLIRKSLGITFYELLADSTEVSGISNFVGFFTQIGLFLWAAAAGICFFASSFSGKSNSNQVTWRSFLNYSALLSLLLLFDDAFQLHETYYHAFVDVGTLSKTIKNLFELAFFGLYGLFIVIYITRFRHVYKKTNYRILIGALICFALSVVIDVISKETTIFMVSEEGFKFLGISMWLFYLVDSGRLYIHRSLTSYAEPYHHAATHH